MGKVKLVLNFKIGDRIIKSRRYSSKIYCCYGGSPDQVPLGTKGTVTHVNDDSTSVEIMFDNHKEWSVNLSELDHINSIGFEF